MAAITKKPDQLDSALSSQSPLQLNSSPHTLPSPYPPCFCRPSKKQRSQPRCPCSSSACPRPRSSARPLRAGSAAPGPAGTARCSGCRPSAAPAPAGGKRDEQGRRGGRGKKKKKKKRKNWRRNERSNFLKTCPGKEPQS